MSSPVNSHALSKISLSHQFSYSFGPGLQPIYVTCDVFLKFEVSIQIYVTILNIGCKIKNSVGNYDLIFQR